VPEQRKIFGQEVYKFWNVPFAVIENIRKVRMRLKDLSVHELCNDFLVKSEIMNIMGIP
jgi:hypothetical protein